MTAPNSSADAFADAVDRRGQRQLDDDTEMLVLIVDRLHRLPGSAELSDAAARPDFRAQLRARLVEEAALERSSGAKVVPLTSRWNQSWGRRNRVRLVSGLAAGIVGLVAVSVAASNALPGSPFYQLKRGSESVQYAFAGSDEARGKLELGFARTRLNEIDRLTEHNAAYGILPTEAPQAASGSSVLATSVATTVVHLFADMDSDATKGSALLTKSFRDDPRPGPLLAVQQFAKDQAAALTTLSGRLAEPALSKATHSLAWATQVVTSTTAVLATCSSSSCPRTAITTLGGSLLASLAPSAAPSLPSLPQPTAPANQTPNPLLPSVPSVAPNSVPVVLPSSAPGSPQPTATQPTVAPPTSDQPSVTPPTDTPPTDTPPTDTQPTATPTTTTTPPGTKSPTPAPTPTTTQIDPPTTTPVATTPPPSLPVDTTPPPPPASVPPTTPDPVTTPPPSAAAPTTDPVTAPPTTIPPTAAPTTTPPTAPTRTGRPPLICLPPSFLLNGICVHVPLPPGVGAAAI